MKLSGIFAVAAACLLLAACGTDAETLKVDTYEVSVAEAVDSRDTVFVRVSLEYPVGGASDKALKPMTESIIGRSFSDISGQPAMDAAVKDYIDATVSSYKAEILDIKNFLAEQEGADAVSSVLSWEDVLEGRFAGDHGGYVSYITFAYSYTGGAHGNGAEYAIVMNRADGRIVAEDQFFAEGYETALAGLLSDHLAEALPDEESYGYLFVKDIRPNGNFYLTEKGVVYIYSPYEIGPYSLGTIRVTVPWDEVRDLIEN